MVKTRIFAAVSLIVLSGIARGVEQGDVVRLQGDGQSGVAAVFHGERIGKTELNAQGGIITRDNVRFSLQGSTDGLSVRALHTPVVVVVDDFAGFSAEVPGTNQLDSSICAGKGIWNVASPTSNKGTVSFHLSDKGQAMLTPGSSAKLDLFRDGSYTLAGRGKVDLVTADGGKSFLSANTLPLAGGPLKTAVLADGGTNMVRVTPITEVKVGGFDQGTLSLRVGGQIVKVPVTGDKGAKDLNLPNGTSVRFSMDTASGGFTWQVLKGEVGLSVDGIAGWKAVTTSDQAALIHWDLKAGLIDLRNTGEDTVIVSLPARTFAVIDPQSSFHYAPVSPMVVKTGAGNTNTPLARSSTVGTYATAATGTVHIYNVLNKHSYDLSSQNLLFVGGVPTRLGVSMTRIPVQLSWDNGVPLIISRAATHRTLQPGEKETLQLGSDSQITFSYSAGGTLTVTALEGNYSLIIQRANGLVIGCDQGDTVSLTLDLKKGTFVVRTDPENPSSVVVATEGGTEVPLTPDQYMNFRLAEDGEVLGSGADGQVAMFEPAGASTSTGTGTSSSGSPTSSTSPISGDPRLGQDPVTPIQ